MLSRKYIKNLLIITTPFMYVCHIPLYAIFIITFAIFQQKLIFLAQQWRIYLEHFLVYTLKFFCYWRVLYFKGKESPTKTTMALIPLMICTTYVYMLATSLSDISWAVHSLIKREPINKGLLITSMVLQFFFCLDIAGAIMHYAAERNMIKNSH